MNPVRRAAVQCLPRADCGSTALSANDGIGQIALGLLQFKNFFLHGVARDEAIGKNLANLADAMGAIDGLRLDGRIPPWIEDENVIGGDKIQAQSTRF
jgi:hypothetical protein